MAQKKDIRVHVAGTKNKNKSPGTILQTCWAPVPRAPPLPPPAPGRRVPEHVLGTHRFAGLDGYVDNIIDVVDARQGTLSRLRPGCTHTRMRHPRVVRAPPYGSAADVPTPASQARRRTLRSPPLPSSASASALQQGIPPTSSS